MVLPDGFYRPVESNNSILSDSEQAKTATALAARFGTPSRIFAVATIPSTQLTTEQYYFNCDSNDYAQIEFEQSERLFTKDIERKKNVKRTRAHFVEWKTNCRSISSSNSSNSDCGTTNGTITSTAARQHSKCVLDSMWFDDVSIAKIYWKRLQGLSKYSWIFLLIYLSLSVKFCIAGYHEKRLLHDLLDPYNTLERPVLNESDPLQLSFGLTLMQIIDVVLKSAYSIYAVFSQIA